MLHNPEALKEKTDKSKLKTVFNCGKDSSKFLKMKDQVGENICSSYNQSPKG